jgi:hypothetical protein
MTETNFRALCEELMNEAIYLGAIPYDQAPNPELIAQARAALAQQHVSQPYKLPEPVAPTDAEIEQWADAGAFASDTRACILELRARVETLEMRCEVQLMQLSDLQDRHHRLTLRVGHLEHELYRDDDEPQQHCLEAMDPPEANSQPEPVAPTDEDLLEEWYRLPGESKQDVVAFARAVLARWGTPANNTREENFDA